MLDVSFTAQGDWFVFDQGGRTLQRGFPSKAKALAWMLTERRKETRDGDTPRLSLSTLTSVLAAAGLSEIGLKQLVPAAALNTANAKARASETERKGRLGPSAKAKIDAKADKVLKGSKR